MYTCMHMCIRKHMYMHTAYVVLRPYRPQVSKGIMSKEAAMGWEQDKMDAEAQRRERDAARGGRKVIPPPEGGYDDSDVLGGYNGPRPDGRDGLMMNLRGLSGVHGPLGMSGPGGVRYPALLGYPAQPGGGRLHSFAGAAGVPPADYGDEGAPSRAGSVHNMLNQPGAPRPFFGSGVYPSAHGLGGGSMPPGPGHGMPALCPAGAPPFTFPPVSINTGGAREMYQRTEGGERAARGDWNPNTHVVEWNDGANEVELLHKGKNGTMHAGETRVAAGEKDLEATTEVLKNTETRYTMLGVNFPMGLKTADVMHDMLDTMLDHLKAGGGHGEFK